MMKMQVNIHEAVKEWYRKTAPNKGIKMQTLAAIVLTKYAMSNGCVIPKEEGKSK